MKTWLMLSLFFAGTLQAHWLDGASWDNPDSRCAFLLGMGSARGALRGEAGMHGFWPSEKHAAETFMLVARLYAVDIGVRPERLATDEWKTEVAMALDERVAASAIRPEAIDAVAYLAGAYVRWGTSTGYRLSGTAYHIAERISSLNEFEVSLIHRPGYPGGTTIMVSDGGEDSDDFIKLMNAVAAAVRKEPRQSGHASSSDKGQP